MPVTPNSIITPQTPKGWTCVTTTGSSDIDDDPSSTALLLTAGANGSRVTGLRSIPRATISAMALHLFLSLDGGTTKRLIRGATIPADTVSTTDAPVAFDWGLSDEMPLVLPAGALLYLSQGVTLAAGIAHHAEGADY